MNFEPKWLLAVPVMGLLLLAAPGTLRADAVGGCGLGSGSTIDATCSGSVTDSSGVWSGVIQTSLTAPFTLSPNDPAFIFNELGDADVNVDQFSFSFNTNSGTFSVEDTTNSAFLLSGVIEGFTADPSADSLTLSLLAVQSTFYVAGDPCSVADQTGCVLTAGGTPVNVPPDTTLGPGTAVINYVGDPVVTAMTFSFPTPTPEPSSLFLLGTGLLGLGVIAYRRKNAAESASV